MTIPVAKPCEDGIGVTPPDNPYFFGDIPDGGIELTPEVEIEQDPRILLSAQLRNCLYVTNESHFETNVPEAVYKDLIARSVQWKNYVEQGGWKNFNSTTQMIAKMVAESIKQEYNTLARIGQEEKCMFAMEKIALHLRDLIRMETFFSSLCQ
ncbi:hypothetical protein CRE_00453 [Caenorhabditis remanei]|uniref:Uncharacterized protein n=1 Tax=Caenorhabditis remanei TaxID=31234 RepID=E3LCR9_CAERE|nr:hypothetical protein CRE_00453 [Caenorhabditis remanei]